ncbi:hypothetical protein PVL29_003175 [Vitis rotundifolia]|uniref:Alpha/beta hydrolase fold-3 domain-containing protein n=1 Tax=Vitis rotundifolia TaxID=103349 RepID=A0AA39ACB3_VITRO|nr:hypothetical protein PVL29_003175 [Vitis rotundifolia]
MDPKATEIAHDLPPFLRAYTDGRVERFFGTDVVPPSVDSETGVSTKDVAIAPERGVSARIFKPNTINPDQKLPLLIYYHGGALCLGSPYCTTYHNYVTSLVDEANIIAVSVDYRLAPEHPVPVPYEDSWAATQWVVSHSHGQGPEAWLNDHSDFKRVFLAGDSAGANIAHNMAIRAGVEGLGVVKLSGICLVHPYFGRREADCDSRGTGDSLVDKKPGVDNKWLFVCPNTSGINDPIINPAADQNLRKLGCSKVLICVAEKDGLRKRGWFYYEVLGKSGWGGALEIVETEGEDHVFYLFKPGCEKAVALMKRLASFMNQD